MTLLSGIRTPDSGRASEFCVSPLRPGSLPRRLEATASHPSERPARYVDLGLWLIVRGSNCFVNLISLMA